MNAKKVIIDCDPGIDDALALMLALRSPELEILGITVVSGNVPAKKGASNAQKVLHWMNRPDIQKKMGLAGVQSVWNWEKGKKMPNIENLFALAEILHTTVDDLCVREIVEV